MRLKRKRLHHDDPITSEEQADNKQLKARTLFSGGRKRAHTLGAFLTGMCLAGRLSAPEVQEAAACAAGSSVDPVVQDIARVGGRGSHRGNCHRDLMSKLGSRSSMPDLYSATIKFWDTDAQKQIEDECHILLPHEVIDSKVEEAQSDP